MRSPVSRERAEPSSSKSNCSGFTWSPSATCQEIVTEVSIWRNTSFTHSTPQITAFSRVMIRAFAVWLSGISWAVMSPLPMSSLRAKATVSVMSRCSWVEGCIVDFRHNCCSNSERRYSISTWLGLPIFTRFSAG